MPHDRRGAVTGCRGREILLRRRIRTRRNNCRAGHHCVDCLTRRAGATHITMPRRKIGSAKSNPVTNAMLNLDPIESVESHTAKVVAATINGSKPSGSAITPGTPARRKACVTPIAKQSSAADVRPTCPKITKGVGSFGAVVRAAGRYAQSGARGCVNALKSSRASNNPTHALSHAITLARPIL